MAIEQLGFCSVPHLLWHGAALYKDHLQGPWHSHLLQSFKRWSCHCHFNDWGLRMSTEYKWVKICSLSPVTWVINIKKTKQRKSPKMWWHSTAPYMHDKLCQHATCLLNYVYMQHVAPQDTGIWNFTNHKTVFTRTIMMLIWYDAALNFHLFQSNLLVIVGTHGWLRFVPLVMERVSCCKFWIYWVGVNTKFTTGQNLQHDTSCHVVNFVITPTK